MNNQIKHPLPKRNLLNYPIAIQLLMFLGKVLPRKSGLSLATFIGTQIGQNQQDPKVKAIRANQWVIHNQSLTDEALEELPKIVFRSAAKCFFDYFYFLSRPRKLQNIVDYSSEVEIAFTRIRNNEPCVFVCPHLSNFDLMGYALSLNHVNVQVLSFPNPTKYYSWQNKLRESIGITVTPMSLSAFRQARKRLREGGSILTGLDRPLTDTLNEKHQPTFFGYKCNLPVAYVRMAKEADAPVMVMAASSQPGGRYLLEGSDLISMESLDDPDTEIVTNAQNVLEQAESLIKKYAHQWAMFYPLWPEFLGI